MMDLGRNLIILFMAWVEFWIKDELILDWTLKIDIKLVAGN
jgi:hypothetical protein